MAGLIPCHDAPPDPELVEGVARQVDALLLVDDGMAPEPARVLATLAARTGALAARVDGGRRGKGHALRAGIAQLRALRPVPDAVLVVDSDGQHAHEAIPEFRARARVAELVIGDRFGDLAAMPPERRLANQVASRLMALRTGRPVRDSQCGMRLIGGRALTEVQFPGGGFEAETRHLMACLRAGLRIAWVPIPTRYDGVDSAFRPVTDSLRVLAALLGEPHPHRRERGLCQADRHVADDRAGQDVAREVGPEQDPREEDGRHVGPQRRP